VYDFAPRAGDDLYFSGLVSNADCVIPPWGGQQPMPGGPPVPPPPPPAHIGDNFNSIRTQGNYSGSVEAQRDLQVNILQVSSGYVVQKNNYDLTTSNNMHAGDLTVSGMFTWTGGGIQDGPRAPRVNGKVVAGKLNLAPGATGLAEPSGGGMVTLGSILTLDGSYTSQVGSKMDVMEGTYKLLNNPAGFVVAAFSTILFKAPVPQSLNPPPSTPGKIMVDGENKTKTATTEGSLKVDKDGKAIVEAANRTEENAHLPARLDFTSKGGVAQLKNAGTVVLKDRAWVLFDHTAEEQVGLANGGYLQEDDPPAVGGSTALLQIEAGCKISCDNRAEVQIVNGNVELTERKGMNAQPLAEQPAVEIVGAMTTAFPNALRLERDATIRRGEGRTVAIPLNIVGQLYWAGDIQLYADHTKYENDKVEVTKRVIVEEEMTIEDEVFAPHLSVVWFDATQGNPVSAPFAGDWTLVHSKFTNEPHANPQLDPISRMPDFDSPPIVGGLNTSTGLTTDKKKIEMDPS
jgi:hypothetical protein